MTLSGDDHRRFLLRVLPWPADEDAAGYVNLHWLTPSPRDPKRSFWVGKPTRNVDDFLSMSKWVSTLPKATDIYMCMSLQKRTGLSKANKVIAARHAVDALALKALWLDIDVKDPPKGYKDLPDALDAIFAFCAAAGLPKPSALVASGGGVHVYWISDRALTPAEWLPYATGLAHLAVKHGLRHDPITTDAARVLRVPGTRNFKTDPPKPVKLLHLADSDIDFQDLKFLTELAPINIPPSSSAPEGFDLSAFDGVKPSALFVGLDPNDTLARGLEREEILLDPMPIMKGCAFLRDALMTGGKDYAQPMWNLTTLASTWMENGNDLAHKMGSNHPGYTHADTEALWDRKIRERKERGLGWPSCSAIQAAGSSACATCPHFAKGKSPLNITAPKPKATSYPNVTAAVTASPVNTVSLPEGYAFNDKGYPCKAIEIDQGKGQPPVIDYIPILQCQFLLPWAQAEPPALNFTVSVDKDNYNQVSLPMVKMNAFDLTKCLLGQKVKYVPRNKVLLEDFFMSVLKNLHEAYKATEAQPFGWYQPEGVLSGFVYGGVIMRTKDTDIPAGFGDPRIREVYAPTGELAKWMEACRLVTDQKRPELECIVAASFAAPLMRVPAKYSALLSVWGSESGAGKSTALKVGQAVWGHVKLAKEVTKSTSKSVVRRMGEIKNLPVFWDEIQDEGGQKAVFETYFGGAEGVEMNRLNTSIQMQSRGDWQTMIITCSNLSMGDYVASRQPTTSAGLYRMLEYKVTKATANSLGQIDEMDADRIVQALEHNYGVMGLQYARLLADDPQGVDDLTYKICADFGARVEKLTEERYWPAACGTILAGATLANRLGCQFDIKAMEDFLYFTYMANRARIKTEASEGGTVDNTDVCLNAFLSAFNDAVVYTDCMKSGAGNTKVAVTMLKACLNKDKAPVIHCVVDDRLIRIDRKTFTDWMLKNKISPNGVIDGLIKHYDMYYEKAIIGAGCPTCHAPGQTRLLTIPVPAGSQWETFLMSHSDQRNMGAAAAGAPTPGAVTP